MFLFPSLLLLGVVTASYAESIIEGAQSACPVIACSSPGLNGFPGKDGRDGTKGEKGEPGMHSTAFFALKKLVLIMQGLCVCVYVCTQSCTQTVSSWSWSYRHETPRMDAGNWTHVSVVVVHTLNH